MSWNAGQLRILRELGHEPMLLASRASAPAAVAGLREQQPAPKAATAGNLAAAVARAAGGRDLAGFELDFERLRREPALKRALWPRLRALRRAQ